MDYNVVNVDSVVEWTPLNSFKTFIVKANAGEDFVAVNNRVRKVCEDIEQIKEDLSKLKVKMGENDTMNAEIDKTIKALDDKKSDIIKKNGELFAAANEVMEYVFQNKASKSEEAAAIAQTIQFVDVYKG